MVSIADRLGRDDEAKHIISYLVARSNSRKQARIARGFVLAIDGDYGQGKSFLVSAMKEQLAGVHPSALIDAWADDRINSPFLAILDGVETAFEEFMGTDSDLRSKLMNIVSNSGPLLRTLAGGAFKKSVSAVAGEGAELAIEKTFESDDFADEVGGALEDGLKESFDRIEKLSDSETKEGLKEYRAKKLSMVRLRKKLAGLASLVNQTTEANLPVFIFIDELDRCRPDYAISLLEEVKHLFDVPGFVFVLSLNKVQLLNSISAVYGNSFEAERYLDRFIDKAYKLQSPSIAEFVEAEFQKHSMTDTDFIDEGLDSAPVELVKILFDQEGLTLREAEKATDLMASSVALISPIRVSALYLSSLVVREVKKHKSGARAKFDPIEFSYKEPVSPDTGQPSVVRKARINTFSHIVTARNGYSDWNKAQMLDAVGKRHNSPEASNTAEVINNFFSQEADFSSDDITMRSLCQKAIDHVVAFEPIEDID